MPRTSKEKAVDHLLTMCLVGDVFSRIKLRFLPETKLQKLVFLSERSMISDRMKGFSFSFIKLVHGPFSQELKNNLDTLLQGGFLNDFGLTPTEIVKTIFEDFEEMIKRNQTFQQKITEVNDSYARMPLEQLLRIIYAMPWGRRDQTIADLPLRTPMLYPMRPENVKLEFRMTDNEVEDLLINFERKSVKALHQAVREMKTGRMLSHEQVFSNL